MAQRTVGDTGAEQRIEALEAMLASVREDSEVAYILLGLSGALAEVRSVEETLEIAVRMAAEIFSADRCFAARWDPMSDRFDLKAAWGYTPEDERAIAGRRGPDAYPLLKRALTEGAPSMISEEDPESGAAIAIPLVRWGENFGGLRLAWDRPRAFGRRDEDLARGIARQVGVALNNARRFHLLKVLRGFGVRLAGATGLDRVTETVLAGLVELLSADAAWIYFLDPTRRGLLSTGGGTSELALPERLARISLEDPRWSGLFSGEGPVVVDLGQDFEDSRDLIGVAVPIFGSVESVDSALLAVMERSRVPALEDLEACQVLAAQSAQAMKNARRFERERAVARSLQRGLLTSHMPELDGYEIEAIYEPADEEGEVGGDLYDSFELPDGRHALVVGDVSGKGAEAAAQTAMVKFTLRAFATRDPVPSSVMFHLNRSLLRDLPEDRFVTLMYAVFDPASGGFDMTVAGHPSPLIYRRETGVETIPSHGTIVGALDGEHYEQSSFELGRGDALLAYTDGLVEARSGDELYGIDRLTAAFEDQASGGPPAGLARRIFERARGFGRVTDDAVVLSLVRKARRGRKEKNDD